MEKKVAGLIVAPMWSEAMRSALASTTGETFSEPRPYDKSIKPALKGIWQGDETYFVDRISGKLATDMTPEETREERAIPNIHSILYWVDKNNPLGNPQINPSEDSQFNLWEYPIQEWLKANPLVFSTKPSQYDDIHTEANKPRASLLSPRQDSVYNKDSRMSLVPSISGRYPIKRVDYYMNDEFVGSSDSAPFVINFVPSSANSLRSGANTIKAVVYDSVYNKAEVGVSINVI